MGSVTGWTEADYADRHVARQIRQQPPRDAGDNSQQAAAGTKRAERAEGVPVGIEAARSPEQDKLTPATKKRSEGGMNEFNETVQTLANASPDQLVLLIILAEVLIIASAMWILERTVRAVNVSTETMRKKVEEDVQQTVKIGEMSEQIKRSVSNEEKRLNLALETLSVVRRVEEQVGQLQQQTVSFDVALKDLKGFIVESGNANTGRILAELDTLFKRFDDAEQSAKESIQHALDAGVTITRAVEGAKQDIINAFLQIKGVSNDRDRNHTGNQPDSTASVSPGAVADGPGQPGGQENHGIPARSADQRNADAPAGTPV